jgi:hypothetical protein
MLRLILIALLLVQSAEARPRYDEHLFPENSIYTDINFRLAVFGGKPGKDFEHYIDYEENVARILHDVFAFDVVARVIAYPSFEPEFATALELKEGKYKILHLEPSVQLLHYEELEILRENSDPDSQNEELLEYLQFLEFEQIELPETREKVKVSQCEIPISNALGAKLYSLWGEMLFRTRYPDLPAASPETKPAFINSGIDGTRYHFSFEYPGIVLAGNIWSPRPESNTGQFVSITSLMKEACHAKDNDKILTEIERRVDDLMTTLAETVY